MGKLNITSKDLRKMGFPKGKAKSLTIAAVRTHFKELNKQEVIALLSKILEEPNAFLEDAVFSKVAAALTQQSNLKKEQTALAENLKPYRVWGAQHIEQGAIDQMDIAMRLPVAERGALMPDAHQGYGLPIGGVLATKNAVIPYGVGVDIGCRMSLSVFEIPHQKLIDDKLHFKKLLLDHSKFGREAFRNPFEDEVLDRSEFNEIAFVKNLKDKAFKQIGSSGSGNHFVEFGTVELLDPENDWNLKPGKYLGLLSHSGSRGLGANIAKHYTAIAMQKCLLPNEAKHLAWLSLDSEVGQEYWSAMNLAGDYASACHNHIHRRIAKALVSDPIFKVENHHNFAWKEKQEDGIELIVHRKGATPAQEGVLGIIPGSMTAPGYIVRGKGEPSAIHSASHGAGRRLSRRKAKQSTNIHALKKYLREQQVELLGGGLDESPIAYKDIHKVMKAQSKLVDVIGTFQPRIVRMDKA